MRLARLEIQGFRSFGPTTEQIDFEGEFAVIYGPNSQGKTSLAEAVEFLLTGSTARRQMVSSAVREFRDALRNAHLEPENEVFVRGTFVTDTGETRVAERRLTRDYGGQGTCVSALTVDGEPAANISAIGLRLSQAPIAAPVLMQHTLRHVISAGPQERTGYFRALLEVADVEAVRAAIAGAVDSVPRPTGTMAESFEVCLRHVELRRCLSPMLRERATEALAQRCVVAGLEAFLEKFDVARPADDEQLLPTAETILADLRSHAFPLAGFGRIVIEQHNELEVPLAARLTAFLTARDATEEEAVAASSLYAELMRLPLVAEAVGAVDCPACQTEGALTLQRIGEVRDALQATETYRAAMASATAALDAARRWLTATSGALDRITPRFLRWTPEERETEGFTTAAARSLLGDGQANLLDGWDERCADIEARRATLKERIDTARGLLHGLAPSDLTDDASAQIAEQVEAIGSEMTELNDLLLAYDPAANALKEALTATIDRVQDTQAWSGIVDLAGSITDTTLYAELRRATEAVRAEAEQAAADVDEAVKQILDEKFDDLSDEVARWWELLRPDEPTSFAGVNRVGEGNRFLDLSARLSTIGPPPRTAVRNAAAVLSDSQLNCLGLASFLARTIRDGSGFVLLDDPIPASDDEHRALFVRSVIPALADAGIQVILTTHNDALRRDIQTTLGHRQFDSMITVLDSPEAGTRVESRAGDFRALLASAQSYMRNPDDQIREIAANRLRKALERLCKVTLVDRRVAAGDAQASVNDYRGPRGTLGQLVPEILPHITDPAHAGLFRSVKDRLNPAAHDAPCPSVADTVSSYNDLRVLGQNYP